MINVAVSSNMGRTTIPVDEHTTIKSVLDSQNVNYAVGMVSIDGATLIPGDINKTFADFGVTDKCFLSVIVKADNACDEVSACDSDCHEPTERRTAARILVAGSCATIESGYTLDELKLIQKFRPAALSTFEVQDGHKTPTFTIGVATAGNGSVGSVGASFCPRQSAAGKAMIVLQIPETETDAVKWAADYVGVAILKIRKIEAGLDDVLAEINAEKAEVVGAVTKI